MLMIAGARAVRGAHPGCFAVVMGTGIVSAALLQAGQAQLSTVLLAIAVTSFAVLAVASSWRAATFPADLRADVNTPGRAFTCFAVVAGCNDIREALLEARLHAVASPVWWQAVTAALCTCRDQLARFERGPLAEFGRRADPGLRNVLGHQWISFTTARARDDRPGLASRNRSLPHLPVPLPRDAQLPRPQRG